VPLRITLNVNNKKELENTELRLGESKKDIVLRTDRI
jgi:hypothetical protein